MKQKFLFAFIGALLIACNNSDTKTPEIQAGETKVAAMSTSDLAYPLKEWGDWQRGSMENLKLALQTLKDFENGNVEACVAAFADSIELRFDHLSGKFSKDSVTRMFKDDRGSIKGMQIEMEDYESVKSKDGKQEYVSLWYKQKEQDEKGNWDSVFCMDDIKIVNGKIATIDEKRRQYPKKKM